MIYFPIRKEKIIGIEIWRMGNHVIILADSGIIS
jgi:uncharacterized protein YuzE